MRRCLLLCVLSLALIVPSVAFADCWCDPAIAALGGLGVNGSGGQLCYTSWIGGRSDAPPNYRCIGDPSACVSDYYTNGFFQQLSWGQYWHSFSWYGRDTLVPGGLPCGQLATPVGGRVISPEIKMIYHDAAARYRRELVQARGAEAFFCSGPSTSNPYWIGKLCPAYRLLVLLLNALLVRAVADAMDPPLLAYAVWPALCTQTVGVPLTLADVTWQGVAQMTQAELDAMNAYRTAVETEVDLGCQRHAVWEAASGAILDYEATASPMALTWVGLHARKFDALTPEWIAARQASRAALVAAIGAEPPEAVPAACPGGATQSHEHVLVDAAKAGTNMWQAGLAANEYRQAPCVTASTFPTHLLTDLEAEAVETATAPLSLLATVCAAGICPPVPFIQIVHPNGGESYPAGSAQTITWTSGGLPGSVRLHLIKDGVATPVNGQIANTGAKNWTIPPVPGTYKIRLTANPPAEAIATDKSDMVFTVTPP